MLPSKTSPISQIIRNINNILDIFCFFANSLLINLYPLTSWCQSSCTESTNILFFIQRSLWSLTTKNLIIAPVWRDFLQNRHWSGVYSFFIIRFRRIYILISMIWVPLILCWGQLGKSILTLYLFFFFLYY